MLFVQIPKLPQLRRKHKRTLICAKYLPPEALNVSFAFAANSGNFGKVFFGQYSDPTDPSSPPKEIVVKCPIASEIGRQLYTMEKYTNNKLKQKSNEGARFPEYMGEVMLPRDLDIVSGLERMGLVWERVGNGDTLEDLLSSSRIPELATLLNASSISTPVRRELTAKVFYELALVLTDLQEFGIVHRDFKPANLLVVAGDPEGTPFKVIDFGSSCDWSAPFKKGIRVATCDPIYTAPERRLDLFKPAYRFDVYSIGLIALRCALPSLTDSSSMERFVENSLKACDFSFTRTCNAITCGRIQVSPSLKNEFTALAGPGNEDMYAMFATVLKGEPADRADVSDCLRSMFVRRSIVTSRV